VTGRHKGTLGRPYWVLWSATTVSSLGDGLALAALPLLAAVLTRDALLVATVVTVESLPWLLVAIPMGTLVDRLNPARAMAVADIARMGVMAAVSALLATGHLTIFLLFVLAFLLGVFETVYMGAAQPAIPQLAEEDQLSRANGLLTASSTTGGHMVGPAIGGLVFSLGRLVPFVADGASFLASGALLIGLRGRFRPRERAVGRSFRREMAEGLSFFGRSPLLRVLTTLTAGLAFFQAMVLGPLVLYVLADLHLSQAGYGYFLGVAAVGNVAGGFVAPRLQSRFSTASILTLAGVLAAVAYLVMAVATSWGVAQVAFTVEALCVATGTVASVTLRQRYIPNEMLGRVSNVFRTAVWGAIPIGALVGGALAHGINLRAPLYFAGAAQFALVVAMLVPLRRNVGSIERELNRRRAREEPATMAAGPDDQPGNGAVPPGGSPPAGLAAPGTAVQPGLAPPLATRSQHQGFPGPPSTDRGTLDPPPHPPLPHRSGL